MEYYVYTTADKFQAWCFILSVFALITVVVSWLLCKFVD